MEEQNLTGQEAKKSFNFNRKKKRVVIIAIAVLLLGSLVLRGAGLRGGLAWGNRGWAAAGYGFMESGNTVIAVKNFEPLGVIFAESSAGRRDGYGITYNMLIKEAVAKGADGIINVSIAPTGGVFNRTWKGSALAIRYLDT